jgi:hypothetical protein
MVPIGVDPTGEGHGLIDVFRSDFSTGVCSQQGPTPYESIYFDIKNVLFKKTE